MRRAASLEEDLFNYSVDNEMEIKETGEKYKSLISRTMMDKNYSATKEWICCFLANSSHNPAKHDYDGIVMTPAGPRHVEAKPHSVFQPKKKLNIKCSWADYTPERLDKDKKTIL